MGCWGQLLQTLIPFPLSASRSHFKAHTVATKFSVGNRFQKKERKKERRKSIGCVGVCQTYFFSFTWIQFYMNMYWRKINWPKPFFLFISSSFKYFLKFFSAHTLYLYCTSLLLLFLLVCYGFFSEDKCQDIWVTHLWRKKNSVKKGCGVSERVNVHSDAETYIY